MGGTVGGGLGLTSRVRGWARASGLGQAGRQNGVLQKWGRHAVGKALPALPWGAQGADPQHLSRSGVTCHADLRPSLPCSRI